MSDEADRVWVPVEFLGDNRWRLADEDEQARYGCRAGGGGGGPACGRRPVMAINRSNGWWFYCDDPEHMYGKQIRDGVLCGLVHKDSPVAERYRASIAASGLGGSGG